MDNLKQYAELKKQIKELDIQAEELKPFVMDAIYDGGGKSLQTDYGIFVITERRTYEYPEEIINLEAKLKGMKAEYEHSTGAILKSVSAYPTFKENKA